MNGPSAAAREGVAIVVGSRSSCSSGSGSIGVVGGVSWREWSGPTWASTGRGAVIRINYLENCKGLCLLLACLRLLFVSVCALLCLVFLCVSLCIKCECLPACRLYICVYLLFVDVCLFVSMYICKSICKFL